MWELIVDTCNKLSLYFLYIIETTGGIYGDLDGAKSVSNQSVISDFVEAVRFVQFGGNPRTGVVKWIE